MAYRPDPSPTSPIASASFQRQGGCLTIALRGELDLASTPGVVGAITPAITPRDERVCIDLADVSFCDSSGMAMLFRLRQRALDEGFHLVVANPTGPVRRTIELCDQSGALEIITDLVPPVAAAD